jgi:hypothetical protein
MRTFIAPLMFALAIAGTGSVPASADPSVKSVKASISGADLTTVVQGEYMRGMRCTGMRCMRP